MTDPSVDTGASETSPETSPTSARDAYWRENLTLMSILLVIWFVVSFGFGILGRDILDQVSIGGAPMGFWFAQQGSIIVFIILIFVYAARMSAIERKYKMGDQ